MQGILVGTLIFLASQEPQERKHFPAEQRFEALQGEPTSQSPGGLYKALLKRYEAASSEWKEEVSKAGTKSRSPIGPAQYERWPTWSFAPRFLELAEANPRETVAVDALLWVVAWQKAGWVGDKRLFPVYMRAVDLLIRDHLRDERIVRTFLEQAYCGTLGMEKFLRAVLGSSRDRIVLGRACLALDECLRERARFARRPWFDHTGDSPEDKTFAEFASSRLDPNFVQCIREADQLALSSESERLLKRVLKDFREIPPLPNGTMISPSDRTIADVAKRRLYELTRLAVGKVAPEIEGQDIDGRPMRLSEYRGKVVVIVFWGMWCPPCRGLIPHERALVERFKGQPFALLGVNSDSDPQELKADMKANGITWPSWCEWSPDGPIARRWNVVRAPMIYVLDDRGVIRFSGSPHHVPDKLGELIETLIKDVKVGLGLDCLGTRPESAPSVDRNNATKYKEWVQHLIHKRNITSFLRTPIIRSGGC